VKIAVIPASAASLQDRQLRLQREDFEARSIGGFRVRGYDAAPPEDETAFSLQALFEVAMERSKRSCSSMSMSMSNLRSS
jgi:hypothetical protein